MTLKAEIDDLVLCPKLIPRRSFFFIREIPPSRLKTNLIPLVFTFDKAFHSSSVDGRELGDVVTSISLISN
jgi:hypothetical protein